MDNKGDRAKVTDMKGKVNNMEGIKTDTISFIDGGVCAAKGFMASGIHCGIRNNSSKKDLALIVSDEMAKAAAVYTTNLVKGAPIAVTKKHIADGQCKAILCNSGNANTCNANGVQVAESMAELCAKSLGVNKEDVAVASTGVIGLPLDIKPIENGLPDLVYGLSYNGSGDAVEGIMTTDTVKKEAAVSFYLGEDDDKVECHIGAIGKGSGMIHPNMATMLVFITSDVAISSKLLQQALSEDIQDSFNMVSIDGDTSTNDMVIMMANGMAGNDYIEEEGDDYFKFKAALKAVTLDVCKKIAADGEGATKFLSCHVTGAKTKDDAKAAAKSVICSDLVKTAMFGADANWGRVLCAIGYSGADVDVEKIDMNFVSEGGTIEVCKKGKGVDFDEDKAKEILLKDKIAIELIFGDGPGEATAYGCDLSYDYVKINGDYRT